MGMPPSNRGCRGCSRSSVELVVCLLLRCLSSELADLNGSITELKDVLGLVDVVGTLAEAVEAAAERAASALAEAALKAASFLRR